MDMSSPYFLAIGIALATAIAVAAYSRARDPETKLLPAFARVAVIGSVVGVALAFVTSRRGEAANDSFDGDDFNDF